MSIWLWLVDFLTPYASSEMKARRYLCRRRVHRFGLRYDSSVIGVCCVCGYRATKQEQGDWELGRGVYSPEHLNSLDTWMVEAGYR